MPTSKEKEVTVNIEFTQEEYNTLTKMLYIAQWVLISWNETAENDFALKHYLQLNQKILSFCKNMNMDGRYFYDEKLGEYFETLERDNEIMPSIQSYDDNVFWDKLIEVLATKDAMRELDWDRPGKYGDDKARFEQWAEVYSRKEALYAQEFSKNGAENLIVNDPRINSDAKSYLQ